MSYRLARQQRKHNIFAIIIFIAIGSIITWALYTTWSSHQSNVTSASKEMTNTSRLLAEKVHRVIFSADIQVSAILDMIDATDFKTSEDLKHYFTSPEIYDAMQELILRTTDIDALSIVDGKGMMFNSRNWRNKPVNVSHREHFRGLRDNPEQTLFITQKFVSVLTEQDIIVFARPIKRIDGQYQGLVSSVISTRRFTKAFEQSLPDDDSQIYLLDLRGNVLAAASSSNPSEIYDFSFDQQLKSIGFSGGSEIFKYNNPAYLNSVRKVAIYSVPGYPLVMAVERSHENIDQPWLELAWLIAGFTLFVITLGLLAVWVFNKQNNTQIRLEDTASKLSNALKSANYATEAKTEFLANMSHEIRTPLNAVLGMANIGSRDSTDARNREVFNHILDSSQHLLGVINDILEFSKLEAGKVSTESRPFQLISTVENSVNMIMEKAQAKDLKLKVNLPGSLPVWVLGDSLRLQQILLNLVSNAVKFTAEGEVCVSVSRAGDMTHIKVTDTGIGLNEEQISRLFTPFEQADTSTTRKFGGTGLGLTISYNLAQLMGGDISVESEINRGSVFTLNIPLVETEAPDITDSNIQKISGPQLQGLRILAAEDVDINRLILEDILEQEGASVEFAENGQQAIDLLQQLGVSEFDIVLMDVQMPVMDGYEASEKIQKMAPELPIIGVTAHAQKEDRDKCLEVGMVDHVTKPINVDVLISTILQHVKRPLRVVISIGRCNT